MGQNCSVIEGEECHANITMNLEQDVVISLGQAPAMFLASERQTVSKDRVIDSEEGWVAVGSRQRHWN